MGNFEGEIKMDREYNLFNINEYALGRAINDEDEESQQFYEELFWEDSPNMWKLMKAIQYEEEKTEKYEDWETEEDE